MNKASSSGVGIGKVSPVRRSKPTFNTTACVAVGKSALTDEVAAGWGLDSVIISDAGKPGSVMIEGTCSLGPGVRVVSI